MSDALIRLVDVTRRYRMGERWVEALRGVSLEVSRGEFVALVGASGSGKSTLMHLIGGLDRPTSGEVWVDGTNLAAAGEAILTAHRRSHVGFIFQRFELLPRLTALENVAAPLMFVGLAAVERRHRAQELLAQVGLAARADHLPSQLSGGEQQRVAIARALVHRPVILLADEPTGNLDSARGREIMELLARLNREEGLTVVVVTHDPETAAHARRVVRLKDGMVVEDAMA